MAPSNVMSLMTVVFKATSHLLTSHPASSPQMASEAQSQLPFTLYLLMWLQTYF